jgi:phage terminase large subunit GpA-like protein
MYSGQISNIFSAGKVLLSDISPSDWNEKNRVMTTEVSPRPGPFTYKYTPYLREVVDCLSQSVPCKVISIMKGAQVGFSTGVIEAGIGWIIAEAPGNILFLTGHSDLAEEAVTGKIDNLIDNTGIRHLIKASAQRARKTRSGDTNKSKEFAGGQLIAGSAGNHKLLRQRSMMYGFIDDFDAAKSATKEAGNTRKMIEQRFAAYESKKKIFYISTPELMETSNIYPAYVMGDQRKYHIPCPCCGDMIVLDWERPMESRPDVMAGIYWELDDRGVLIRDSVGYVCYKCGDFFDDTNKTELLSAGRWIPTAIPKNPEYRSYHLSALYAPVGMSDWTHYVQQYLEAAPPGGKEKEDEMKAFYNLCLGLPYEEKGTETSANQLQRNTRNYAPGTIPEALSIEDGNGTIVLLTLAVDLNGKEEDARVDWEVLAWSESGATYSVDQGSIGTFVPKEKTETDREKWTYEHNRARSVWPVLDELISQVWIKDNGRKMRVAIAGIDAPGHFAKHAYRYIDETPHNVVGLKGDAKTGYTKFGGDLPIFKPSRTRKKLYILEVDLIKDQLAALMSLSYSPQFDETQPTGFMNFPTPEAGKYTYSGFYIQFEAEHRVVHKDASGVGVGMKWKKKNSAVQNHFFDVRVYNIALREILLSIIGKQLKRPGFVWADWVDLITSKS